VFLNVLQLNIKMRFSAATTHRSLNGQLIRKHKTKKLNLQRSFPHLWKRTFYYKENTSMSIEKQNQNKPRVLILGATGRTGIKVIAELERINTVQVVYSSRNLAQVETWRRDGKAAVLLDLDQPETFPEALAGIDRLFLVTGYTAPRCIRARRLWTLLPTRASNSSFIWASTATAA
jgi:hypothetical protein